MNETAFAFQFFLRKKSTDKDATFQLSVVQNLIHEPHPRLNTIHLSSVAVKVRLS